MTENTTPSHRDVRLTVTVAVATVYGEFANLPVILQAVCQVVVSLVMANPYSSAILSVYMDINWSLSVVNVNLPNGGVVSFFPCSH